ncbi:hypothetical protein GLW08_11035 [Pontibacillus yanchengensis]|uniref:Uncharacterized protein n=2 Tax=Pontibacillus yanchengensis TaxID=462910 RepID=A0ACC7VGQ4_9BACI|nr:acetoacetate decarboxylase family protein [Pontibacillus yanchengensis]MYL33843.1 hypothetical protein [Pontibacillus yanchengensis]MYL53870.1 hypothetical protein [Pontibacillus yanchengensis]
MKSYEYSILPEYAPLYSKLPYHYKNFKKVSAFCKADKTKLQQFLPKEFEVTSDVFEVFVLQNDYVEGLDPYSEGGLVIPCKYKELDGACMAFEYVDTDDALCAGREIWGYPKKLGEVTFHQTDDEVYGSIKRKGKTILEIQFKKEELDFEPPALFPRLQVKRMPHPEVYGTDINWIIRNEFENATFHEKKTGSATVNWEHSDADPLAELGDVSVIGAQYVVGDFTLSYGNVLEKLEGSSKVKL